MPENQNAAREQSFDEQWNLLDIDRFCLVNCRHVRSTFVAYQKGFFQEQASLPYDFFEGQNFF